MVDQTRDDGGGRSDEMMAVVDRMQKIEREILDVSESRRSNVDKNGRQARDSNAIGYPIEREGGEEREYARQTNDAIQLSTKDAI